MHVRDIAVATALVLSFVGLIGGLLLHQGGLVAVSAIVGTVATSCAVAITLVLAIVLLYRSLSGTARPLFERSWLGLVNGAVSGSALALFVWRYGS